MTHLREQYWAVEVPEGAKEFGWIADNLCCKLSDSKPGHYHWLSDADDFMHRMGGEWQIVCTSKEVTNQQARLIVERTHAGGFGRSGEEWKNYTNPGVCFDPLYSLNTLLTSKGCDLNKNWLILKKQ